jgi:hypothetical protein
MAAEPTMEIASATDAVILLAIADSLHDAYVAAVQSMGRDLPDDKDEGAFNFACGEDAGFNLTFGSHNFFIGRRAGYYYTTESYRVVIADKWECDLRTRECWYLNRWRPQRPH